MIGTACTSRKPLRRVVIPALLAVACFVCACTADPLDGRSPAQAIAEASAFMELTVPTTASVVGYRAGVDERFLRIVITDSEYQQILKQRAPSDGSGWQILDGMNPIGIEDWWTPKALRGTATAEQYALPSQRGQLAIVAGPLEGDRRTVFLYCFHA